MLHSPVPWRRSCRPGEGGFGGLILPLGLSQRSYIRGAGRNGVLWPGLRFYFFRLMEIVTRIITKILNMDCTPAKREFCGQERPRSRSPLLAGPLRPVTSPCPAATDDRSCD